jgi:hypothetical protein
MLNLSGTQISDRSLHQQFANTLATHVGMHEHHANPSYGLTIRNGGHRAHQLSRDTGLKTASRFSG